MLASLRAYSPRCETSEPGQGCDTGRCHCTAMRKASRRVSQRYDEALAEAGIKSANDLATPRPRPRARSRRLGYGEVYFGRRLGSRRATPAVIDFLESKKR